QRCRYFDPKSRKGVAIPENGKFAVYKENFLMAHTFPAKVSLARLLIFTLSVKLYRKGIATCRDVLGK
ncbi:hypothetical protein, partial [Deinococcus radiodurans]|uniref:hypothetical protein n=1 Tax=Deinococcus radiodurans TaxID=1299 RepID=UPI001B8086D2